MRKTVIFLGGLSLCLMLTACEEAKNLAAQAAGLPTDDDILFWTQEQRDKAFRIMGDVVPSHDIEVGEAPRKLEMGKALPTSLATTYGELSIDDFMEKQRSAGLIVLHEGKIRYENYALDFEKGELWTSFSVAKSFVSTLVGAAIKDGAITSLSDPLTDYIPELAGSGYDGVSVEQLLTMSSGVQWDEDYTDPDSDVSRFNKTEAADGIDPIIIYMRGLKRDAEPGTRWQYNTGETNLIGVLVQKATGKSLAAYLTEKVWAPYGMVEDGQWLLNEGGKEIGGCCISASVRDFALFGQFVMDGAKIDGVSIVPDGWFEKATVKQQDIGVSGAGYGYQWWTFDDGGYAARGIFGQGIFIDPKRKLVMAINGNWPTATSDEQSVLRVAMFRAIQRHIDGEKKALQ